MTDLVAASDYARETGDTASQTSDVTTMLAGALKGIDEFCHRHFAYTSYTETLYVYRDGKCYPSNTPIASVSNPAVGTNAIQGAGLYLGVFLPVPGLTNAGDWSGAIPPQAQVTYMGGYQPYGTTDGVTPEFPWKLMRAVCRIAYLALHPVVLAGVPVGARSVSMGDVSISAASDISSFVAMDASIERDLRRYIKRQARGWQRA